MNLVHCVLANGILNPGEVACRTVQEDTDRLVVPGDRCGHAQSQSDLFSPRRIVGLSLSQPTDRNLWAKEILQRRSCLLA
jgi:hypothetical protein